MLQANPDKPKSMSGTPHANGGLLTRPLDLPDFRELGVPVEQRAGERLESTRKLGELMREAYRRNPDNFRLFCPDETNSNRLGAVFEVSDRTWLEEVLDVDMALGPNGRVMEVLSEHNCHGWLEAYTLTGRHGLFATYEAFAMVSASQTIQHGKWLQEARQPALASRRAQPEHPAQLDSWRNDHNGFSHQGPGLLQVVLNGGPEHSRIYLPPDANCLLSVADHCFRSTQLREPDRPGQAAAAAVADHGRGDRALHPRGVHLGVGRHRGGRGRTRHRDGLRRRHHDDGDCRGGRV